MDYRKLVFSAIMVATCAAAHSQSPEYGLGKTPSAAEIKAWDITISPDGKGLPIGSGTADVGAKLYAQKCAVCHGANGVGGQAPNLASKGSGHPPFPAQMPFPPVLWDYIHRAMPMLGAPGTLKPDEVYSLTAFLLFKNGIIKEDDVLDAQTLPKVIVPSKEPYAPPLPVKPWPITVKPGVAKK